MMGEPQIIRTPGGEELVIVPRAEYEALVAAADEALEDAADLAIARHRWEQWTSSGQPTTPPDVGQMLLEGTHVLEAFRRHRAMTIEDLAECSGVSAECIAKIESSAVPGEAQTLSSLADALNIDRIWLLPASDG